MNQTLKKTNKIRFMALFPIIMTILSPYSFISGGGILICDILVIFLAFYFVFIHRSNIYIPLFLLLGIDFLLTIFSFFLTESSSTNLVLSLKICIVFALYLFVYSSVWACDIRHSFYYYVELIGIICALFAIFQFAFSSIGFDFYDGRLFLPLSEGSYFGGLYDRNTGDLRVHSFFEEPSYLAFFEIPITAHLIQEKKYIKAMICGLSCIVSGSMVGILGLIIVMCAILLLDSDFKTKSKIRFLVLIIATIIALICVYNANDSFRLLIDYYMDRIVNIESSSNRVDSSFSQRIFGNIALFNQYNFLNMLIGVGFNQYSLYFGIFKDYSNDFVSNLLNFGYIGFFSLIAVLFTMIKNTSGQGRIFFVIFIILLAIDHSWFGTMFFYILTWLMMKSNDYKLIRLNLRIRF